MLSDDFVLRLLCDFVLSELFSPDYCISSILFVQFSHGSRIYSDFSLLETATFIVDVINGNADLVPF